MKKILVTGALGQLGNSVLNQLYGKFNILATDVSKRVPNLITPYIALDVTQQDQIDKCINKFYPDVILNLAAYTDVDGCELNPEKAYQINTKAVELLSNNFQGQFIQISTDYIFDGLTGPYAEDATPNPLSTYGKSKLAAELLLPNSVKNFCIVRSNVLYDYYIGTKASFIKWVVDSLKSNKTINVVNDQWNNPTWTVNMAEIIELIISKYVTGVYNYCGATYLNRFEFAEIIADVFELNKNLISIISTASLNQAAPRPLKGGLRTEKIERELNVKCANLADCINSIKERFDK